MDANSAKPKPTELYLGDIIAIRKQLISKGVCKTHIFQSMVRARRIDLPEYMNTYWRGMDWEVVMQDAGQMVLYKPGDRMNKPSAVWPVFSAEHHTMDDLINFCKFPWSARDDLRKNADPADFYFPPRRTQENVVWIAPTGLYSAAEGLKVNLKMYEWLDVLDELKQEYGVKFGIAHSTSYKLMFSGVFDMASMNPHHSTSFGNVHLPNGAKVNFKKSAERFENAKPLMLALGYTPLQLAEDFKKLALFNIDSVRYAAVNWGNEISTMRVKQPKAKPRRKAQVDVQPDKPDAEVAGIRTIKKAFPAPPRVPTR